ncbi:MAG: enoyl-[acyl-carrier-protein] reductase FabK [Lachnospiraceae bacterium]|nr:enoyl-[acyl-carrier-protein] reductase FabK [Lachnospiraceae bacterium]
MDTRITELLGIAYPIIQGGMAWVAEYHLAAAVSQAGGLGIISAAGLSSDALKKQIRKARALTKKPFGVHIVMGDSNTEEIAEVVVEEGVQIVTTDSGSPVNYMGRWRSAGIKVIPTVSSVALAKMMEHLGAAAVIAEGLEAGGHIGATTTMTLIPQVADALKIPVIASGGIGDSRGFAAAMILGADGIQMRTRFCVAEEAIAHPNYKERIIKAKDIDSTVTGMSQGRPMRQLGNRMSREYLRMEEEGTYWLDMEKAAMNSMQKAVLDGDVINGTVMVGQAAGIVTKEQSCGEILQEMTREAEKLLNR